jgi:hypothetical protein
MFGFSVALTRPSIRADTQKGELNVLKPDKLDDSMGTNGIIPVLSVCVWEIHRLELFRCPVETCFGQRRWGSPRYGVSTDVAHFSNNWMERKAFCWRLLATRGTMIVGVMRVPFSALQTSRDTCFEDRPQGASIKSSSYETGGTSRMSLLPA